MLMMNRKSELQGLCASNPMIGAGRDPQDSAGRQGDIPRKQDHALVRYLERKLQDCGLWIS
jgi:hypothetical protein